MKPVTRIILFAFAILGIAILGNILSVNTDSQAGILKESSNLFNLMIVDVIIIILCILYVFYIQKEKEKTIGVANDAALAAKKEQDKASFFAQSILNSTIEPLSILDHEGNLNTVNQTLAIILGKDRTSLVGLPFAEFFEEPEMVMGLLDKVRSRGSIREITLLLKRSQGESRAMVISAGIMGAEGNELRKILIFLHDITEIQKGELHALKQITYLRNLIEVSIDPLFAINSAGMITDVNEATVLKTGIPREDLVGAEFSTLFTDKEAARQGYEQVLREGSVLEYPLIIRSRTGLTIYVSFNASLYRDDKGEYSGIFAMARDVTAARQAEFERINKAWVADGIAELNDVFQVQGNLVDLAGRIISCVTEFTGALVGAFYIRDSDKDSNALVLTATHAYTKRKSGSVRFLPGEGIVGQAALEGKQIMISNIPQDYFQITSGLGESAPRFLCVTPLIFEGVVRGMLEIASLSAISDNSLDYLKRVGPSIAVAIEATQARESVIKALQKSQQLSMELEAQQVTLQNANAELEEQTMQLKASEQKLWQQQKDLERSNTELEEQAGQMKISEQKLQAQQSELEMSNDELLKSNKLLEQQKLEIEQARKNISAQVEEVALASKYKSDFLANMSHELRTPLNSLLLLARSLGDNASGNLTADQVESAKVIFASGSDLLNLINEILDLSKIEAGRMELHLEEIEIEDLERSIVSQFDHMAKAQGLDLKIVIEPGAPTQITTDGQRLGQVIKNLLGNALKFTEQGGICITFSRPAVGTQFSRSELDIEHSFAIHVRDTGIGIHLDKQKIIFEAFQQADSGDRRRFGGTGLGLSISREMVALLGGEIHLVSEPKKGSTFSIYLPIVKTDSAVHVHKQPFAPSTPPKISPPAHGEVMPTVSVPVPAAPARIINDDRNKIVETDRVMLVVEDDLRFGTILAGFIRERGFKCILAETGEDGLALIREHKPNGIILDIQLPGMDGWAVLNAIKQDMSIRHIPVHIISVEESSTKNMSAGAIGHAAKPIGKEQILEVLERLEAASTLSPKRVLVVEDDDLMRKETVRIIGNDNVTVDEVATGKEALNLLRTQIYNLAIVDLGLPDMGGLDLMRTIQEEKISLPPVIIHTVRELTIGEEYFIRNFADSIIIKDVRSQERLIDEVSLFLHRVVRDLPEENRRVILHLRESDEPLLGKKVLIVEDDMRTMFAMARMLAGHGMEPLKAEHGERALEILEVQPDVNMILMDIMMPVMDGYETIRRIRNQERFSSLPIIALTAKAMKEDRQKCLDAGATDYLSKPVDPERLISLMRVLLCR